MVGAQNAMQFYPDASRLCQRSPALDLIIAPRKFNVIFRNPRRTIGKTRFLPTPASHAMFVITEAP